MSKPKIEYRDIRVFIYNGFQADPDIPLKGTCLLVNKSEPFTEFVWVSIFSKKELLIEAENILLRLEKWAKKATDIQIREQTTETIGSYKRNVAAWNRLYKEVIKKGPLSLSIILNRWLGSAFAEDEHVILYTRDSFLMLLDSTILKYREWKVILFADS